VQGPKVLVLAPTETSPEGKKMAASLKRHEYVRLTDAVTGEVRIEKGEQLVVPRAMETMEKKQSAVDVDLETAVLVVSKETGQQRLVVEKGLFFPGAYDEILEVRKLIRVEPHETAIVLDQDGNYTFYNGSTESSDKGTAFFLQPHCSLVTMEWSTMAPLEYSADSAARKQRRVATKTPVKKIDLRSKYLSFDYNVRTSDNVELIVEGLVFWQVVDPEQMLKATGDPQGDVWYHCRSSLIAAISRASLETFMTDFNTIVNSAAQTDEEFYKTRGVSVHSLEVTRYECTDKKTSSVLQEIIQETTNRINRLQQQHSENEVSRERMAGEIEIEKQRAALIHAKTENDRILATSVGESDGIKLAKNAEVFLTILGEAIPNSDDRLNLLRFFGEQNAATQQAEHLASGHANLFLTPQDMNLKLKVHSHSVGSDFEKP
jgi:regulator of protease activity HflC (stomatin/prohibitin superfamily)